MSEIFHLVYRSDAVPSLKQEAIVDILNVARNHNQKAGLTGLLIYRQHAFIQLLEGDEKEVRSLYERIRMDSRHEQVQTMIESKSEQRIFDHWSMAYVDEQNIRTSSQELFDLFDVVVKNNQTDRRLILPMLKRFLGILPEPTMKSPSQG